MYIGLVAAVVGAVAYIRKRQQQYMEEKLDGMHAKQNPCRHYACKNLGLVG